MAPPDFGGLDTPRTNLGDATYLGQEPDFDMTQEPSFQSPSKDNNLLQQMRTGRLAGVSLRTPRAARPPLGDKRNLPLSIGGAEFTPLLKSATRNGARRYGKENLNGLATPALGKIEEDMDMTNIPVESSLYGPSRGSASYLDATPMPEVDISSTTSTPMVVHSRRGGDKGPLNDGNQLSLREQENVIDRIEKENFGLKLKIHFLEEALRKAGPGFSEAALKENTDLKVDKVTMQRELHKYKKQLSHAEQDLESYQKQILEVQEKAKKKYADESQKIEIEKLRRLLDEKDADIEDLQRQLDRGSRDQDKVEQLQDDIGDLEADLRAKDREINEREEEIDNMKTRLEEAEEKRKSAEDKIAELEDQAHESEELDEAKETIEDLEANVRRLEQQVDEMKEEVQQAVSDKNRAEGDLEELQEELSDKSMVTKGLSRQVEEKLARLQSELDKSQEKYTFLEQQTADKEQNNIDLKNKAKQLLQQRDSLELEKQGLTSKLEEAQKDLSIRTDEKNLLQLRHDALGDESASLQRDVANLQKQIDELEDGLEQEKTHALQLEQNVRNQYKDDIDRLNDEISDLQAEVREKDNLYDNDSEKWENDKHNLESERDRAEERAAGLQRTIDRLREAEGSLTDKETRLQEALDSEAQRHRSEEAVLSRQIDDLRQDLDSRQAMLTELRAEVSAVRDELRQSQLDHQSQLEKIEALEDEVEVLQATLDDESEQAKQNLDAARQECEDLRLRLQSLQNDAEDARATNSASQQTSRQTSESLGRLQSQLSEATAQLSKVGKEKQSLQDQLANLNIELHSLRASLADTKAEREELEEELRRSRDQDNDTYRADQERIDLRTAKIKSDSEVRRLRDENRSLSSLRKDLEKSLEDEIEKAAAEEERLGQEILQLQTRVRQSSGNESQELATARRSIRELERKVDDYEAQIAAQSIYPQDMAGTGAEGNSELSLMRRDLSSARQKELDLLHREAEHKDIVRGLKRQIADLERKLHDAEMTRFVAGSPNASMASTSASARKKEIAELRHQLSTANQSSHDIKQKLREAERATSKKVAEHDQIVQELQAQLEELEDQNMALQQGHAEAKQAAAEASSKHEKAVRKLEHQIVKLQHQSSSQHHGADVDGTIEPNERKELHGMLRESRAEVKALEHDIRQQVAVIASFETAQKSIRQKLDKTRGESVAYRTSAKQLKKDCERLQVSLKEAIDFAQTQSQKNSHLVSTASAVAYGAAKELAQIGRTSIRYNAGARGDNVVVDVVAQKDHEAVIRAADNAAMRHEKELRGMAMQMQWMQARWERESKLRGDAAFAKRFLELRVSVAEACNKADLRILAQIHKQLGIKSPDALLSSAKARSPSKPKQLQQQPRTRAQHNIKVFATALRAIAKMRISARAWGKHEKTRAKLLEAWEDTRKREPARSWASAHEAGDAKGTKAEMVRTTTTARKVEDGRKRSLKKGAGGQGDDCVEIRL